MSSLHNLPVEEKLTFSRFTTFTLGQILVLPPAFLVKRVTSALLKHGVWTPLLCGSIDLCLILVIIWAMPIENSFLITEPSTSESTNEISSETSNEEQAPEKDSRWRKMFGILYISWAISLLICTFFATTLFGQMMAGSVFLQYVEKRLGIDIGEVFEL